MSKQKVLSITTRTDNCEDIQRILARVEREKQVTGNTRSRILMDMLLVLDKALGEKSFYDEMKNVFAPYVRTMMENNTPANNSANSYEKAPVNNYEKPFSNDFLRNGR